MDRKRLDPISLEDLASHKLPPRILDAIGDMEITLEEFAESTRQRPRWRIVATERDVCVDLRIRLPSKAALGIVGGLGGLGLLVEKFLGQYLL